MHCLAKRTLSFPSQEICCRNYHITPGLSQAALLQEGLSVDTCIHRPVAGPLGQYPEGKLLLGTPLSQRVSLTALSQASSPFYVRALYLHYLIYFSQSACEAMLSLCFTERKSKGQKGVPSPRRERTWIRPSSVWSSSLDSFQDTQL